MEEFDSVLAAHELFEALRTRKPIKPLYLPIQGRTWRWQFEKLSDQSTLHHK